MSKLTRSMTSLLRWVFLYRPQQKQAQQTQVCRPTLPTVLMHAFFEGTQTMTRSAAVIFGSVIVLLLPLPVRAQIAIPTVGIINTVAGNGTPGYSGDGGAATSAELYGNFGVAVDRAGNIYLADAYNERIRKVTASTGAISTVAGNGTQGYSGDGGAATSAELNQPEGIAVDSSGNIYIADLYNNRIRKVTASTGVISTVAGNGAEGYSGDGGAATSAELYYPSGVAIDSSGNIYIANDARIREVAAATGVISTVAGNGTMGFSGDGGVATLAELYPIGIAVDSSGNIYDAEPDNSRIRIVGHELQTILPLAVFSNLQTASGWQYCTGSSCAGGTNNTTADSGPTPNTTYLGSGAADVSITGTSADGLYYDKLGGTPDGLNFGTTSYAFVLDSYYSYSAGKYNALENDIFQYMDGYKLQLGTQCNFSSGVWDVWNQSSGWVPTSIPCNSTTWPAATSNHYILAGHTLAGSPPSYCLDWLMLNGVPTSLDYCYNGTYLDWGANAGVDWQVDMSSPGGTGTEWANFMTLYVCSGTSCN